MDDTTNQNNKRVSSSQVLPPIDDLRQDVENFRVFEYIGEEKLSVKVCPNGLPGIVFQHYNGKSGIQSIVTKTTRVSQIPTLYLYGQVTDLAVMNFKKGPYIIIQVVLKPHALKTLFGIDASTLTTKRYDGYQDFSAYQLNTDLINAKNTHECMTLLTKYLLDKLNHAHPRDRLIEESLQIIHRNINTVTVNQLIEQLHISERQFEKRFIQTVGLPPQFYIRVKRFNEAINMMDSGKYERLSDIAQALNFYDQSHFIRDIKEFSGITPKSISQKANQFHYDEIGASYLE